MQFPKRINTAVYVRVRIKGGRNNAQKKAEKVNGDVGVRHEHYTIDEPMIHREIWNPSLCLHPPGI